MKWKNKKDENNNNKYLNEQNRLESLMVIYLEQSRECEMALDWSTTKYIFICDTDVVHKPEANTFSLHLLLLFILCTYF